jgi:hypothetical protein
MAPVTALLLLACIVFNQHAGPAAANATNGPLVQRDQNILTANTFEWTNGSRFTSSIHSRPRSGGKHNQ